MRIMLSLLLAVHWLVASDLHVIPHSSAAAPGVAGKDTNWGLFDSTLAQMKKADPGAPVVILPGDFLEHHFPNNAPLAEKTMSRIARSMDRAFPRAQFVVVPGNNDDPCGDYRATPGSPYFARLAQIWAPLVNRRGAAPNFARSFSQYGWYSAALPGGERLVALDSVYWSVIYRRCANYHPDAPKREMRWFEQTLRTLPEGSRALVVMHIPPGVDPHSTLVAHRLLVIPFMQAGYSAAFVRTLAKYRDRIAFVIAGHEHRDDFRVFGSVPVLLAPSISPIYDNNPAFLELDLARDGSLNDYTPVAFDEETRTWRRLGSFDATYGVAAFSASALARVRGRLHDRQVSLSQWNRFFMSGSGDRDIDSGTWSTYWCAQANLAGPFVQCTGMENRLRVLPIIAGVAAAVLLGLIAFAVMRRRRARGRR